MAHFCGLVVAEKRKEPSTKEFGPGTAVHLALQSLEAVNLPLGLTIAPKLTDGVLDRFQIMPYRIRESA